ncbi:MAG: nucleotidyltransferase domain-containing protein [Candidatus Thermoplasmatota archaeon]|nr:nucleotidyltransferase domain-containing protein [Candidatus Thermoplasmatota archaeon]
MTMETTMADKTDFTKYQKKDDQSTAGVAQNGTMIHELKERVKELNCFYRITKIIRNSKLSIDEALQEIVKVIPPAWQYPEITCVRIYLEGREFKTDNFQQTEWKLDSRIVVDEKKIGVLEVFYLEEQPQANEGPFLTEERKLIDAISDLLSKFIEERRIKEELERQRQKLDYVEKMMKAEGDTTLRFRSQEKKQDWEVILDLLAKTDPRTLLRLTRKMAYHLYRMENEKITNLLNKISPVDNDSAAINWRNVNTPNQREELNTFLTIQKQVFEIAKDSIPADVISTLFANWMKQDKARPLLLMSQKTGIPLVEITAELNRFFDQEDVESSISPEDKMSIKTALIRRFFAERLEYVNVAKTAFELKDFVGIADHIVGPAQGSGKLGGKASGVLLAEKLIKEEMKKNPMLKNISFPTSWYITSDTILSFIHYNDLDEVSHVKYLDPLEIRQEQSFLEHIFKNSTFPFEIVEGLRKIVRDFKDKPVIVRSSSLLEDNFGYAFSGKYKSLFVPNKGGTEEERLKSLINAITEVYASTFSPDPIEYRRERGLLDFNEEMGILIQEVVGSQVGPYFMPTFAGVAFSRNEFRWSPRITREDGMIRIVPGLGTRAVDRVSNDYPILISPKRPNLLVNTLVEERVKYSPRFMDVINTDTGMIETVDAVQVFKKYFDELPKITDIVSIHDHGRLTNASKILMDPENADIVITFQHLFEKTDFLEKIKQILSLLEEKIGVPVDVEFASSGNQLYILQCRPQSQSQGIERKPVPKDIQEERKIFFTKKYVTTGNIDNIEYIVYVVPEEYTNLSKREQMLKVAKIISELNVKLPRRKFILIGPGRWGSKGDIKLGVPVRYGDINNCSLMVEIAKEKGGYTPELSFGTHFFQDLVESNIRYLPLYPDQEDNLFNEQILLDMDNKLSKILQGYKNFEHVVKVISISDILPGGTLSVIMDGEANEALAYLRPSDHLTWRTMKIEEITQALDPDLYGIQGMYLIGSTKDGSAGPTSDIDLLVHFNGTEEQKDKLMAWFDEWGKKLAIENKERTGFVTDALLDVHIITDEDIKKKSSWASHITSPYQTVRKLALKKDH